MTYEKQWEILQELKKEPEMEKKLKQRKLLLTVMLISIVTALVCMFLSMIAIKKENKTIAEIFVPMITAFVLMIVGTKCSKAFMSRGQSIGEELDKKLKARVMKGEEPVSRTEEEKRAYIADNRAREAEQVRAVKGLYALSWGTCGIVFLVAVVCLLFLKGIAVLGLLETNFFEIFKEFIQCFSQPKAERETILLYDYLGLGLENAGMKYTVRLIFLIYFVSIAIYALITFFSALTRISKGSAKVESLIRTKNQKYYNASKIDTFADFLFTKKGSIIYWVVSTLFQSAALLLFPCSFLRYLEQFCIVEKYVYIILVAAVVIAAALRAFKQKYIYENRKVLQPIMMLFEQDSKILQ